MSRAARALGHLRWVVVVAWIAAAVACTLLLPTIHNARTGALGPLVPQDTEAVEAELASKTRFGFPLLSRTLIVQRDPDGLPLRDQAAVVQLAVSITRGEEPGFGSIQAALPLTNAIGAAPFARERSTTALTYLFIDPDIGIEGRTSLARNLVARRIGEPPGSVVGVTGQAPALVEQADLIVDRLPLIELATFILVALAVGIRFRAIGAPVLNLVAVAIAYLVSSRLVAFFGEQTGVAVPQEVEPIMVVLLFGVVTDYSIFYLSRFRALLGEGIGRREAAQQATSQISPIIATAGLAVVASSVMLLAAELQFLRVFGPGLAFTVLIGLAVSITFIPACLAIFGRALFWPRRPRVELPASAVAEETPTEQVGRPRRSRAVNFACRHPWRTVAASVVVLGAAASGIAGLHLSNPVIRGLPEGSEPRVAYEAAVKGFAPGIVSPTVVVAEAPGIARDRAGLTRLQALLERRPGVALVVGPAQQPVPGLRLGATRSRNGNAARYFVVLEDDPLGAEAIVALRELRADTGALLGAAGLATARVTYAGDTALSAETIDKTVDDLGRIAPLVLVALFLVMAVFLRAIVAPLYLLAASVLGFAAALGIGAYIFGELTYFVPFAVAVLLISLGSDYNVFLIGRIWQEARRIGLAAAVPVASARAAKAITLAGLVLAGSFALIALIPVRAFTELAVIMTVGLLIDAFLVRTVLVPALVTIVGPVSAWPGRRLEPETPVEPPVEPPAAASEPAT